MKLLPSILFIFFSTFAVFCEDSQDSEVENPFNEGFLKRTSIEVSRKQLRPAEFDVLVQKLGVLALYFRLYKEFVPVKGGRGFPHKYPEAKTEIPDDLLNKCTDGLQDCVDFALSHIQMSHPWFYPKNAHGLDQIQLQKEFLEQTIHDHTLESDLALGQVFCYLTMNENEAFKHLPFCRFGASKNNENPLIWYGKEYTNFQTERRPLDSLSIEPFECAKQSFCPDSCCHDLNPNSREFTNSECNLNVCKDPTRCYLKRELNGDFLSQRSNSWNISCPCPVGYIHRSDVEQCVHENKCGTETPCREDQDCLNTASGEGFQCVCHLGTVMDRHNQCISYSGSNVQWNSLALSEPNPSIGSVTMLWCPVVGMALVWLL